MFQKFKILNICRQIKSIEIIPRRFFALKYYQQFVETNTEPLTTQVNKYIKNQNLISPDDYNLSNFKSKYYNESESLEKLQSAVTYSLEPCPNDVFKLYTKYAFSSRTVLRNFFSNPSKWEEVRKIVFKTEIAIREMNFESLLQFSILMKEFQPLKLKPFKHLVRIVFENSISRSESEKQASEIVKNFLIGIELYGNYIGNVVGYQDFLSMFQNIIAEANAVELSHILYFVGLSKRRNDNLDFLSDATNFLFEKIDDLSFLNLGIAIAGLFKIGYTLPRNSEKLKKIANKIQLYLSEKKTNDLDDLESFALVSMFKYLRMCLYSDDNFSFLQVVKSFFLKLDDESLNPQLVSNVLSLYANINCYDGELYSLVESKFFDYLKHSDKVVRIKDLSRIMWAFSHVQHPCKNELIELVIQNVIDFTKSGDFQKLASHAVDCTLAMASYGIYNEELISSSLKSTSFDLAKGGKRTRHLSKVLVMDEIQKSLVINQGIINDNFDTFDKNVSPIENYSSRSISTRFNSFNKIFFDPAVKTEVPFRQISSEIHYRPAIGKIAEALKWLENKLCAHTLSEKNIETPLVCELFQIKFLIPYINHSSVVLNLENFFSVEFECLTDFGMELFEKLHSLKGEKIAIDVNDANTSFRVLNQITSWNNSKTLKNEIPQTFSNKTKSKISESCTNYVYAGPVGLEKLKRDLLILRGWKVKVLSLSEIVNNCVSNEEVVRLLIKTALSD